MITLDAIAIDKAIAHLVSSIEEGTRILQETEPLDVLDAHGKRLTDALL